MSDAVLEQLKEISARLGRIEADRTPSRPILSTEEAAALVGLSERAFRDWAARWSVRPCAHGRWPRGRVNAGFEREARQGDRKARKARAA